MNRNLLKRAVKAATARAAEEFSEKVFQLNLQAFTLGLRIEVVEGPKSLKPVRHRPGTWRGKLGERVNARGYRVTAARLAALAKARKVRAVRHAARKAAMKG